MANSWQIVYSNLSSQEVTITSWKGITEEVVGEINHETGHILASGGGKDYLAMDQNALKFIASGALDFYQGLNAKKETLWVRLHVPVQVFGIGTSPYFYVYVDNGSDPGLGSSQWEKHDRDQVIKNFGGLKATVEPTGSHTNLTVSVTLEDAD